MNDDGYTLEVLNQMRMSQSLDKKKYITLECSMSYNVASLSNKDTIRVYAFR